MNDLEQALRILRGSFAADLEQDTLWEREFLFSL